MQSWKFQSFVDNLRNPVNKSHQPSHPANPISSEPRLIISGKKKVGHFVVTSLWLHVKQKTKTVFRVTPAPKHLNVVNQKQIAYTCNCATFKTNQQFKCVFICVTRTIYHKI